MQEMYQKLGNERICICIVYNIQITVND